MKQINFILSLGIYFSIIPVILAQQVKAIDHKGTLKNVTSNKVTTSNTAPTTPVESDIWFDTSTNGTKVWDGTSWKTILASSAQMLWDTDADTGIQVEETADEDHIRFDTAGTERMIINSNGNVGIGTSSPSAPMSVVASSSGSPTIATYATDGTTVNAQLGSWGADNSALALRNSSGTLNTLIHSSGTSYFNGGNVGIGTSSPLRALTVAQDISGTPEVRIGDATDNSGSGIEFMGSNNQKNFYVGNQQNVNNGFEITPSNTTGGADFTTPAVTVLGTGHVGIGTTAPSEKLHVAGGIRVENLATGTSTDYLVVVDANGVFKKIQPSSSSGSSPWYGSDDNQPATTNTENIYSMGNVGIGTNNPGFDLDINGTVRLQNSGYVQWNGTCPNPGEIRFDGDRFYGCAFNGSNISTWQML